MIFLQYFNPKLDSLLSLFSVIFVALHPMIDNKEAVLNREKNMNERLR
jgi:hypothetical protein